MSRFPLDLRHAVRKAARTPGFAAAAVLTLALGIGATTALYGIVQAVLLAPLPFPEPDRLVRIWGVTPERGVVAGNVSPQDFLDWQRVASLESVAAMSMPEQTVEIGGRPERIRVGLATASLWRVLGVEAAVGRLYTEAEDVRGGAPVVVLSHAFWRDRLGGRRDVIGSILRIDEQAVVVVGVAPEGFTGPEYRPGQVAAVWRPLRIDPATMGRGGRWLMAVGRLAPDAGMERAQAELDVVMARLEAEYPDTNRGVGVRLESLRDATVSSARVPLLVLFGAVACILLLACVNLSALLLGQAARRQGEMVLRAALGASRARLVGQALVEALALAAMGGVAGALLAWWATGALVALAGPRLPRAAAVGLDAQVLVFAFAITLVAGLAMGVLPALVTSRVNLQAWLRDLRGAAPAPQRLRAGLVIAQVALAVLLASGAGLAARSLFRLTSVDPGFEPASVATFEIGLPESRYERAAQRLAFHDQLQERVAGLPGVTAAGAVNLLPLGGGFSCDSFTIADRPDAPPGEQPCAEFRIAAGDYFAALAVPLLDGRTFVPRDRAGGAPVAVINQAMAQRFFADGEAIGRRIGYGDEYEIIGVVGNVRHFGLDAAPAPEVYLPFAQYPFASEMTYVVRGDGPTDVLLGRLRTLVREIDAALPFHEPRAMQSVMEVSVAEPRFRSVLLALLAALALGLAAIGIHGMMAQFVAQRVHEIGVRRALGGDGFAIIGLVVRRGLALVAAGIALGVALSAAAARAIGGILFGVEPTDPATWAATIGVLTLIALLALWLPARRAARVDPAEVLRRG